MHINNSALAEIISSPLQDRNTSLFPASLSTGKLYFHWLLNLNSKTSMRGNFSADENPGTGFSAYPKVNFLITLLSLSPPPPSLPKKKQQKLQSAPKVCCCWL